MSKNYLEDLFIEEVKGALNNGVTEEFVKEKILEAQLGGGDGPVDLSAYAKQEEVTQLKSDLGEFLYELEPTSSSANSIRVDIYDNYVKGSKVYVRIVSISGGTALKGNIYGFYEDGTYDMLKGEVQVGGDNLITLEQNYVRLRVYMNVRDRDSDLVGVCVVINGSRDNIATETLKIRELINKHEVDYENLHGEVVHTPVNLYAGEYIPNGYYDTDGTWVDNANYKMLKLTNGTVKDGDTITFSSGFAFYQDQYRFDILHENGRYVKYFAKDSYGDGTITLKDVGSENFKLLMRVRTNQDDSKFVAVTDGYLEEVTTVKILEDKFNKEFNQLKSLKGKKINCLGDSFTAPAYSWCSVLEKRTGCECNNYGSSSSRISIDTTKNLGELDENGNPIDSVVESFLNRYDEMDSNADVTIIFGGINDANSIYYNDLSLGDMNSELNNTTFYGALRLLIENIKSYMPGKKIIGVIPPDFQPTIYYSALDDVRTACRTIYEFYGIPYADLKKDCQEMYEDEYNNAHYRKVNENNWHPSELGQIAISEVIQGTLEKYIKV